MIKRLELTDPNSCMARAGDEEMTFVLLERDWTVPTTLRHWIETRVRYAKNGRPDAQIVEAEACLSRVIASTLAAVAVQIREAADRHDDVGMARLILIRREIANCRKEGLTPEA